MLYALCFHVPKGWEVARPDGGPAPGWCGKRPRSITGQERREEKADFARSSAGHLLSPALRACSRAPPGPPSRPTPERGRRRAARSWGSRMGRRRGGVAVSAPFLNLKIRGSGNPERPYAATDGPQPAQRPQFPPRKGGRRAGREFAGNVTSGPPAPAAG